MRIKDKPRGSMASMSEVRAKIDTDTSRQKKGYQDSNLCGTAWCGTKKSSMADFMAREAEREATRTRIECKCCKRVIPQDLRGPGVMYCGAPCESADAAHEVAKDRKLRHKRLGVSNK